MYYVSSGFDFTMSILLAKACNAKASAALESRLVISIFSVFDLIDSRRCDESILDFRGALVGSHFDVFGYDIGLNTQTALLLNYYINSC